MTYTEIVEDFIRRWGMITHRKIMQITGCNCPYSVLRDLRKRLNFTVKEKKTLKGKRYNLYILVQGAQ